MPNFTQHINQVKKNLEFLEFINTHKSDYIDWQITAAYYSAVHLINAHLATSARLHFSSHGDVNSHISPGSNLADGKAELPTEVYVAYKRLTILSRISRYLSNDGENKKPQILVEKDLIKSFASLDFLLTYFSERYTFDPITCKLKCSEKGNHVFKSLLLS